MHKSLVCSSQGLTISTYLVELLLGHVGLPLGAEGTESALDLLTGFHVLCFPADHESHVLLQRDMSIPASKTQSEHPEHSTARPSRDRLELFWKENRLKARSFSESEFLLYICQSCLVRLSHESL